MRNILVTGGAGYIGSILSFYLLNKNLNVFIIDNLSRGHKKLINKKASFFKLSLKNSKEIRKIVIQKKIDTVIHLAAFVRVDESIKNPSLYLKNNVEGTISLIESVKNTLVKRLIFSSSSSVYGKTKKKISETNKTKPISPYGKSKLQAEKKVIKLCEKYNLNNVILRYFNVVGAQVKKKPYLGQINKTGSLFQNLYLYLIRAKKNFSIFGFNLKTRDGTCIRDFIHVMDLAEIHYLSAKYACKNKKISEIFNCGYGNGHTVKEVTKSFGNVNNKEIIYRKKPYKKGDIVESVCDNKKILRKLKWKPKHNNLKFMVKDTIKWFDYLYKKDNKDRL